MWIAPMKAVIILFLSTLLMGACTGVTSDEGSSGSTSASLTANPWKLTSIHRGGGVTDKLAGSVPANQYSLVFTDEGQLSLQGGCNTAGSDYQLTKSNGISMGAWRATRRACVGPLMQADKELTDLMSAMTNYTIEGEQLRLNGGGSTLIFTADQAG